MKTDALITLLADGVAPVPRHAAQKRLGIALLVGLPLSLALMQGLLGARHDLMQAALQPMLWIKFLFPVLVALAGFALVQRLARPGVRPGAAWVALALPFVVVWSLGLWQWFAAPESDRSALLWGLTWRTCPFGIAAIAAPVFVASMLALKDLAPTRLTLAGAAAGAMSGGAGAAVYALHCPEHGAPFLAVWYVLGIVLMALVGAALGPRLLRW